ncbi:MAG: gluconeogenesis factor YvcK family protein [Clostridia bacterium]
MGRWLLPGLHLKRWLALLGLGLMAVGFGLGVVWLYPDAAFRWRLGAGVGAIGLLAVVAGTFQSLRSLSQALNLPQGSMADWLMTRQRAARGPKVVALGGGTGMPTLLRGLKSSTSNITAIVTVADDGGSSGRLRGSLGMLPPGDVRNCLVALADAEPQMRDLFQYRFQDGELSGHSFGNLFIAAMERTTGDFVSALGELSRVLAVRGAVFPVTLDSVRLVAELEDGTRVEGESHIGQSRQPIRRVWLEPEMATPLMEAIRAIEEADLIVIGPGSLYTSVIPNLLVREVADAIRKSPAPVVYIANVMTQPGETAAYTAYDHLAALEQHSQPGLVDVMVVNNEAVPPDVLGRYREEGADVVRVGRSAGRHPRVLEAPLLTRDTVVRHDPAKLADAVLSVLFSTDSEWVKRHPFDAWALLERIRHGLER